MGFSDVTEAGDGAEPAAKAAAGKFDLVPMDWNMPNLAGIDALKQLKARDSARGVPVIMVTSESGKARIMEALQAGATGCVVKPFPIPH